MCVSRWCEQHFTCVLTNFLSSGKFFSLLAGLQTKGPTLTRRAWGTRKDKAASVPRRPRRAGATSSAPTKALRTRRRQMAKTPPFAKNAQDGAPGRAQEKLNASGLGFLGGTEEDFADEALRGLGEEHGDGVGYVIGLEHFLGVLCGAMRKIRGDGAGANGGDADAVGAEIFGHGVAEAEQAPFGGAIGSAARHGVFSGEGADVDDVATRAREHSRDDGAADEEHSLEIGV